MHPVRALCVQAVRERKGYNIIKARSLSVTSETVLYFVCLLDKLSLLLCQKIGHTCFFLVDSVKCSCSFIEEFGSLFKNATDFLELTLFHC